MADNDPAAMGPDNYPTPGGGVPDQYYYQSYRYHVPGAGSPMPPAEFQTIESINWQIQNERPDNASTLSGMYSMVHIRIGMIRDGIVSAYNSLGQWTSPAAKDAFRERVSTTYWDLHHIAEKVDNVRAALADLALVMENGQSDMRDLYDEYLEAMRAWDAAKTADMNAVDYNVGLATNGNPWPNVQGVEEHYLGEPVNDTMTADRDVFKAEWDRRAREKRDQIGSTYTDAIGKLAGSIPIVRVLDTHPHPEIQSSGTDITPPPQIPGGTPSSPGTPAPPGPAPGPAPVPANLAPVAQMVLQPAPPPPQNPGPAPGPAPGEAPGAPPPLGSDVPVPGNPGAPPGTAPIGPAVPGGTGAGPAGVPGLPLAPGLAPLTPGGLGASPGTQGSQVPAAPSLLAGLPTTETLAAALDPSAAIGPQPPGSVITSPASINPSSAPAGPPALPPGAGMPPGMNRPAPGMPNRQQPQRPGGPANQRGPGAPALPAMPGAPGQAGAMPPGLPGMPAMPGRPGGLPPATGMPPGAQPPAGNQRSQQPAPPAMPGIPTAAPQAFAPPTPGAPPVLGNPQQRRGQRQPGSPAEAPPAAPSGRSSRAGIGGGTPPILANMRYTGPRRTYTEEREVRRQARRERTRRVAELLRSQLAKGVPTGTAPVLEGPAPVEPTATRITEVPVALRPRQPVPSTLDRHARPDQPADRTTRRVMPERPAAAPAEQPAIATDQEAWDVETPGGPVVASEQPKRRRGDPPPTLGARG